MSFKDITIKAKTNGIEVKVGCWNLVYSDMKQFHKDLKNYMKNPDETEKELRKRWKIKDTTEDETPWALGEPLYYTTSTL